jgi:hypothetical protein
MMFYNYLTSCIGCFSKIILNRSQITILEKFCDTLLPMLMSGEVQVDDVEKLNRLPYECSSQNRQLD